MPDGLQLRVGQERPYHLPSLGDSGAGWDASVEGMTSAVEVRKLWKADPYPEDDRDDEEADGDGRPSQDEVFMIRGTAPGTATVVFRGGGEVRRVEVGVSL